MRYSRLLRRKQETRFTRSPTAQRLSLVMARVCKNCGIHHNGELMPATGPDTRQGACAGRSMNERVLRLGLQPVHRAQPRRRRGLVLMGSSSGSAARFAVTMAGGVLGMLLLRGRTPRHRLPRAPRCLVAHLLLGAHDPAPPRHDGRGTAACARFPGHPRLSGEQRQHATNPHRSDPAKPDRPDPHEPGAHLGALRLGTPRYPLHRFLRLGSHQP